MTLSARLIKEARTAAGLTQVELARRAGTSQPTIAAYESGDKIPNVATLERLLGAAGASLTTNHPQRMQRTARFRRLLSERRKEILEVAATHHASNVRVFGSVPRGEETDGSDIDLLVDMEPGRSLLDQVRLRRAMIELLGVDVDVVTSGGLLQRDKEHPRGGRPHLMAAGKKSRPLDAILADIEEAAEAAQDLIGRGRDAWDRDRLLRLAGEAVIGRIADATNRLPEEVKQAVPDVPWDDIRDIRILVDYIYHRVDYDALWKTLAEDVSRLLQRLRQWR